MRLTRSQNKIFEFTFLSIIATTFSMFVTDLKQKSWLQRPAAFC